MAIREYLQIIGASSDVGRREVAAKALLEELASGAELAAAERAALEAQYRAETSVSVLALLKRALTRLDARALLGCDPSTRFDPKLSHGEREALHALVARLRVVVDEAHGGGEFDRRYEIIREIPNGAMGRVLLGRRRGDGRLVAIKVLLEQYETAESFRARFRREARVLERLDHPHVVRLYEWGEIGSRMYLVMEYLGGGDLADRMAKGPLPLHDAAPALLQTLEAIEACHRAGIIHRDVKPGNLFLNDGAQSLWIKLGDFGLAKDLKEPDGLTHEYTIMGSEPYTAPEQRQDPRHVGPAADLYSFGVTAYEVLSGGQLPVGNYPPLSFHNPALPAALGAVIARCLAPRPEDRWQDARELKEALAREL